MEKIDFLPLGSVVRIKGGVQKYMVVARGLNLNLGTKQCYFDYGGCLYPQGIMGDQMIYFHHSDITKVLFNGFDDDDNKAMVENINDALSTSEIERADIDELKKEMEEDNGR